MRKNSAQVLLAVAVAVIAVALIFTTTVLAQVASICRPLQAQSRDVVYRGEQAVSIMQKFHAPVVLAEDLIVVVRNLTTTSLAVKEQRSILFAYQSGCFIYFWGGTTATLDKVLPVQK